MKSIRRLVLAACLAFGPQAAFAQWTFNVTFHISGECATSEARMAVNNWNNMWQTQVLPAMQQSAMTREECERMRTMIESICSSFAFHDRYCSITWTIGPCVGKDPPGSDIILGPSQGQSFLPSTPSEEIKNWQDNVTDRMAQLGGHENYQEYPAGHTSIWINNESFNKARDDSRGIDITKPYIPSQERENTLEVVSNVDIYSVFQEFTQLRNSGELQYETPEEFIEAMIQQSEELWLKLLRLAKMPHETFIYILNEVLNDISWESNRHNLMYEKELKEAEFKFALSKYMVEYEKYQISKIMNNLDEYGEITDKALVAYTGKNRDQMAREGMEKVAKELFEKYGITDEQLEMARNVVDNKKNYADMVVGFVKDYRIDQLGDGFLNISTQGNTSISIGSVMDVGLILNKGIVLYGLWQENATLGERVQSIKDNHESFQELSQDELDKAGTIMTIMDNHNIKEYINNDNTPPSEKVKWALKTYNIIKRIEKNGENLPEEIFPGKFRQRIRKEVTYILKMPWE